MEFIDNREGILAGADFLDGLAFFFSAFWTCFRVRSITVGIGRNSSGILAGFWKI